jgi:ABC-2 type transport system permease protein
MNKTILILRQEYLKRVKKKSFIILTILVPLIFIGMFALIIYLSVQDDKQERVIAVYDESTLFQGQLEQDDYTRYHFIPESEYNLLKTSLKGSEFYALLYIPENIYTDNTAQLTSEKQLPIELTEQISRKLGRFIENDKRQKIIDESGIPDLDKRLSATQTRIRLNTLLISETGEAKKSSSEVAFVASYAMGFIIYFFVRIMPGIPKANVKSRVILTPEHAKRLLFALQDNIQKFEAAHGTIKNVKPVPHQGMPPMNFGGPTAQA